MAGAVSLGVAAAAASALRFGTETGFGHL